MNVKRSKYVRGLSSSSACIRFFVCVNCERLSQLLHTGSWKWRLVLSVSHWLCSKEKKRNKMNSIPASANISKRLLKRLINLALTHISMTYIPIHHSEMANWSKDNGAALQHGWIMETNSALDNWHKAGGRGSMKRCSLIPSDPHSGVVDGGGGSQALGFGPVSWCRINSSPGNSGTSTFFNSFTLIMRK